MTRLEVMKSNQKRYEEFEKTFCGMADGIEKAVAVNYTLPWIKGNKWMGGMSDSKAQKVVDMLVAAGYDEGEVLDEMDRQVDLAMQS